MASVYAADFETTVYEGQEYTEVWSSALAPLWADESEAVIFHSIGDTYDYLSTLGGMVTLYYHNLKFDGEFWLNYLLTKGYHAAYKLDEHGEFEEWLKPWELQSNEMTYNISSQGQWYKITFRCGRTIVHLKDSYKLMPFSLEALGKAFHTTHRKTTMEYEGYRYAGCEITPEEKEYQLNDVYVLKEALEIMFGEGHDSLTIGACCLKEYKKSIEVDDWSRFFPRLDLIELNPDIYGSADADEYIRRSYKGGWCYLVPERADKIIEKGITVDVNSLYPSMMSSESGNYFPVGLPTFWEGDIPEVVTKDDRYYYFVRLRCRFKIKKGKLPFIQVKGNPRYKSTEMLTTSDIKDKNGNYHETYTDKDGKVHRAYLTLTLTCTDYELMKKHYNMYDVEILDGCYFHKMQGLFDEYIEHWKKVKIENEGNALRTLAKLFQNNLYGKLATSRNSSFKLAELGAGGELKFHTHTAFDKDPVFIACGSAITSYSRRFTITAAQENYHGKGKAGFIYADTDSIHCDLNPDELKGVPIHSTDYCHWKIESYWDTGKFVRQKTYVEHVTHENGEEVKPWYNIKCAGLPQHCKELFLYSMGGDEPKKISEAEKEWCKERKRTLDDFTIGLVIPSKLVPKHIKGGVVLEKTDFTMRET